MNSIQQLTSGLTFKPPHLLICCTPVYRSYKKQAQPHVHTCPVHNHCTVRSLKRLQSFKNQPITKQTRKALLEHRPPPSSSFPNLIPKQPWGADVPESSLPSMGVIDLKNNCKS